MIKVKHLLALREASEQIAVLRGLLLVPSTSLWCQLWTLVDAWSQAGCELSLVLSYLEEHLDDWPDSVRELPSDQLRRCLDGVVSPMTSLVRACHVYEHLLYGHELASLLNMSFAASLRIVVFDGILPSHKEFACLMERCPSLHTIGILRVELTKGYCEWAEHWQEQGRVFASTDEALYPTPPEDSSQVGPPKHFRVNSHLQSGLGATVYPDSIGVHSENASIAFVHGTGGELTDFHLGQAVCAALLGLTSPVVPGKAYRPWISTGANDPRVREMARCFLGRGMIPLAFGVESQRTRLFRWICESVYLWLITNNDEDALFASGFDRLAITRGVLASFLDGNIHVWQAGDCRVFRYRWGVVSELTVRQNLAQMMIEKGLADVDVERVPAGDILMCSIGGHELASSHGPSLMIEEVEAGDVYLLCSRNVTIDNNTLINLLSESFPDTSNERLASVCERLLRMSSPDVRQDMGVMLVTWDG